MSAWRQVHWRPVGQRLFVLKGGFGFRQMGSASELVNPLDIPQGLKPRDLQAETQA
jgi:hypothetical protein